MIYIESNNSSKEVSSVSAAKAQLEADYPNVEFLDEGDGEIIAEVNGDEVARIVKA